MLLFEFCTKFQNRRNFNRLSVNITTYKEKYIGVETVRNVIFRTAISCNLIKLFPGGILNGVS